jgi:integrase
MKDAPLGNCSAGDSSHDPENGRVTSWKPPFGTITVHCSQKLLFAIRTGMRLGDILKLKWQEVDIGQAAITFLMQKTQRIWEMRLNSKAETVVGARHGIRKCEYVFYNPETVTRTPTVT